MTQTPSLWRKLRTLLVLGTMLFTLVFALAASVYMMHLDDTVRARFEGRRWAIPARVFARPLVLETGRHLTRSAIKDELVRLSYREVKGAPDPGTYEARGSEIYLHLRGFDHPERREDPRLLRLTFAEDVLQAVASTREHDTAVASLEPMVIGGIYPSHSEDRVLIRLQEAPQHLVDALLATEDQNFYQHMGISPRGILRAVWVNFSSGAVRQGGSTLTQQLVKNFYLSDERTLRRKINEALMALLLEWHYSKTEILETYLNEVNLGQQGSRSINGFGLAAQFYFGRPLAELTLPQVALLVGMVKGPSFYNPRRQPQRALERRNVVLDNLYNEGRLSAPDRDAAAATPLDVLPKPMAAVNLYPDFIDLVRRQLRERYQPEDLSSQGLRVFTTLDPRIQDAAQLALDDTLARLRAQGRTLSSLQGVVLAADGESGELQALVGGTGLFTGYNRATDASRQVGSLLKPLIYLTAIQQGNYTWASEISDDPVEVPGDAGSPTWTPQNYDHESHGNVSLQDALALSYNQAAVRLGMTLGLSSVIETLRRVGVSGDIPAYPSVLLGAVNQTPMAMLQTYQVMLSGGTRVPLSSIRAVVDDRGNTLQQNDAEREQVIAPAEAYVLHHGLQQVMRKGTGASAYARIPPSTVLAGKTGTTNDLKDSWFAGSAGRQLALVWLGRDDNKSIGLSGSQGALPVWTDLMARLRPLAPVPALPAGAKWAWIDRFTGKLSDEACAGAVYVPVTLKSLPTESIPCASGGVPGAIDNLMNSILEMIP